MNRRLSMTPLVAAAYALAPKSGGLRAAPPDSPPGSGRRGSLTPLVPKPGGKWQPTLFAGPVRQMLQRWQIGSRWAHTALPKAPTPTANPP
jgi:hypothetical protein